MGLYAEETCTAKTASRGILGSSVGTVQLERYHQRECNLWQSLLRLNTLDV